MLYDVFFQPQAIAQIQVAQAWYEEQRYGLGEELIEEIMLMLKN